MRLILFCFLVVACSSQPAITLPQNGEPCSSLSNNVTAACVATVTSGAGLVAHKIHCGSDGRWAVAACPVDCVVRGYTADCL